MNLHGCEHAVGICYCGSEDNEAATCARCGVSAALVDDLCAGCLAIVNAGCECGKCAIPVAIEDDRTTPVGHVTDAQLLAEFRAVRS